MTNYQNNLLVWLVARKMGVVGLMPVARKDRRHKLETQYELLMSDHHAVDIINGELDIAPISSARLKLVVKEFGKKKQPYCSYESPPRRGRPPSKRKLLNRPEIRTQVQNNPYLRSRFFNDFNMLGNGQNRYFRVSSVGADTGFQSHLLVRGK